MKNTKNTKPKLNKGEQILKELFSPESVFTINYESPSDFMIKSLNEYDKFWQKDKAKDLLQGKKEGGVRRNLNGGIFELLVEALLIREGIKPLYKQASVAFVPDVMYDFVLYTDTNNVINLSCKTTLRERYKQAALESYILKNVHRKAECYLICRDNKYFDSVNKKINEGMILGLDQVIHIEKEAFNKLFEKLKQNTYIESEKVEVIKAAISDETTFKSKIE